jgi:hypothetical protein
MSRNQFYYTRTEEVLAPVQPEVDPLSSTTPEPLMITKIYHESFNINNVIRSVAMPDGRHLVLLNDIHERSVEVPDINTKTNRMNGYKRERNTYQSEIFLTPEDAERLKKLTEILE